MSRTNGDRLSRLQKLQMEIDNRRMEDSSSALTSLKTTVDKTDSTVVNGSNKPKEHSRFMTASRYVPLSERAGSGLSSGYGSQDSLEKRSTLSSSNSSMGSSSGSSREVFKFLIEYYR